MAVQTVFLLGANALIDWLHYNGLCHGNQPRDTGKEMIDSVATD